jgi:peptide/nickel transport system ATP-binding protein
MTTDSDIILEVKDLQTHFFLKEGVAKAVDGVSFRVGKGEILGIVGESGSGKSVTGFSIMGLVNKPGKVVGGHIKFRGDDLADMSEEQLRMLRGNRISIIFQDANVSLNPVLRIDTQMIETVLAHNDV